MHATGSRKCLHCSEVFVPDARNRRRQHHCTKPACRHVRKVASQRRWSAKPENREHWHGAWNAERVREWQKAHPGYWKRPVKERSGLLQDRLIAQSPDNERAAKQDDRPLLQDDWKSQPPLLLGLIAKLTGVLLQDDMAVVTGGLIATGQALVGPKIQKNHVDPKTNPLPGAAPPRAGFFQLY